MVRYERLGRVFERFHQSNGAVDANLFVVVLEGTLPKPCSSGNDWFVNLKVVDPLSDDSLGRIELMVFGPKDKLPCVCALDIPPPHHNERMVEAGDILRLTSLRVKVFNTKWQLNLTLKPGKSTSWVAFRSEAEGPEERAYFPCAAADNNVTNFRVLDEDMRELDMMRQAIRHNQEAVDHAMQQQQAQPLHPHIHRLPLGPQQLQPPLIGTAGPQPFGIAGLHSSVMSRGEQPWGHLMPPGGCDPFRPVFPAPAGAPAAWHGPGGIPPAAGLQAYGPGPGHGIGPPSQAPQQLHNGFHVGAAQAQMTAPAGAAAGPGTAVQRFSGELAGTVLHRSSGGTASGPTAVFGTLAPAGHAPSGQADHALEPSDTAQPMDMSRQGMQGPDATSAGCSQQQQAGKLQQQGAVAGHGSGGLKRPAAAMEGRAQASAQAVNAPQAGQWMASDATPQVAGGAAGVGDVEEVAAAEGITESDPAPPLVYPAAASGSVHAKLSTLPSICLRRPPVLADLCAQVVARDERLVETHQVLVLYLWDGTDIPLLQRSWHTQPAVPHGTLATAVPPLRMRHAPPLATREGDTQVMDDLPHVASLLPLVVPCALQHSLPAVGPTWIKLRKVSPFVHQGQVQAMWLPCTKWAVPAPAPGGRSTSAEVAAAAQARLSACPLATCQLLPPNTPTSLITRVEGAHSAAPLATIRQLLSSCPQGPVRLYACVTRHHPSDVAQSLVSSQDEWCLQLPGQECQHGWCCFMKLRLEDATGECDALLVGASAAKFFTAHMPSGTASVEAVADELRVALMRLEGQEHDKLAGVQGVAGQRHAVAHVQQTEGGPSTRQRTARLGVQQPSSGLSIAAAVAAGCKGDELEQHKLRAPWGEFCLWPVVLPHASAAPMFHVLDTAVVPSCATVQR